MSTMQDIRTKLLSCAVPHPSVNLLAEVRYDGRQYVVKECVARFNAIVANDGTVTVQEEHCCFKDYTYVLWRVNDAEDKTIMVTVEEHQLEVVHNEPTVEAAIAWIKNGPNDPTTRCRLVPVRDTNIQHNHHTALVHMMSLDLLERHAYDGVDYARELLDKWQSNRIDAIYFPRRPEEVDSFSDENDTGSDSYPEHVE